MKMNFDQKQKIQKYFYLQAMYASSVNIYATEVLFALTCSSSGCSRIDSLFTSEEQKKVGR